jgi:hypothetical protein
VLRQQIADERTFRDLAASSVIRVQKEYLDTTCFDVEGLSNESCKGFKRLVFI